MTFKEEMKERTEAIEKLLVKYLPKAEGYQSQIMEAMEYSVMAGGKRLRPMLMQETYLSLIHISEPTRQRGRSRMPSSA